ncbi:hypothetical protein BJH93_03695 [Kocuria polaris]|nr:hypothetical protein [Kocuria polaris]
MVMIAALALAACAGNTEEPASSSVPPDASSSQAPATDSTSAEGEGLFGDWEEPALWWIVEKYDDAFVLAGAAGIFDDGGVTSTRTDQQVPLDTSELEVHVYCTPVGAMGALEANSHRTDITCPGTEDPQIVRVSAEGLETSSDLSWNLTLDETDEDWRQAVVFLPTDS